MLQIQSSSFWTGAKALQAIQLIGHIEIAAGKNDLLSVDPVP